MTFSMQEAFTADLYPAVAPVCHDDVSIHVHGHSCGCVKLTIPLAVRAELQQELPLCVEHLHFGLKEETIM